MDAIALGLANNLQVETKREGWNLPKGPKYRVYQSAVSTYGNKIYVSGGQQTESRSWLQIFDPSAGSWETLPLPVPFYNHAQVTLGDFIYLVANQNSMGEHRRYNISSKTFTARTAPIQQLYAATAEANPDLGVYNLFGGENAFGHQLHEPKSDRVDLLDRGIPDQ